MMTAGGLERKEHLGRTTSYAREHKFLFGALLSIARLVHAVMS